MDEAMLKRAVKDLQSAGRRRPGIVKMEANMHDIRICQRDVEMLVGIAQAINRTLPDALHFCVDLCHKAVFAPSLKPTGDASTILPTSAKSPKE